MFKTPGSVTAGKMISILCISILIWSLPALAKPLCRGYCSGGDWLERAEDAYGNRTCVVIFEKKNDSRCNQRSAPPTVSVKRCDNYDTQASFLMETVNGVLQYATLVANENGVSISESLDCNYIGSITCGTASTSILNVSIIESASFDEYNISLWNRQGIADRKDTAISYRFKKQQCNF
jgi:hypothetical protein